MILEPRNKKKEKEKVIKKSMQKLGGRLFQTEGKASAKALR